MSSEPVISLRSVSKTYRAYDHPLHGLISRISGGRIGRHKEFHALNDVSINIHKGETVGIIGRNGSGKSTLLQIICGIRQPTSGSVSVKGRISALLELGSGFQPEFTGRENVFLQGAIIGLSREEMEARFDEIAIFADIGEYLDQPVKTYSSGMFVRLAFAVAVAVEPDILVVDEALSVGDMTFQNKCMNKMTMLINAQKTILFVSHNLSAIKLLCDRVIYLENGRMRALGSCTEICDLYEQIELIRESYENDFGISDNTCTFSSNGYQKIHGEIAENSPCKMLSVQLSPTSQSDTNSFFTEQDITCILEIDCQDEILPVSVGVAIMSIKYGDITRMNNIRDGKEILLHKGLNRVYLTLNEVPLLRGRYSLSFYLSSASLLQRYHLAENAMTIIMSCTPTEQPWDKYGGLVAIQHQWLIEYD